MSVQVQPPARRPRQGGIKTIVGEFISEPRLTVSQGGLAWEDSGCGLPRSTRAGCYDVPEFDPVTVDDGGATFLFSREGDTVTVVFDFGEDAEPTGFQAPWAPIEPVDEFTGEGHILISVDGAVSYQDAPSGEGEFTYAVAAEPKYGDGVSQYTTIGDPFARYAGVECYLGGDSVGDTYERQAQTLLEQGEDRAVESELWNWAADAASPGTAADIAAAIAAVEEQADVAYVGAPVILLSRRAAVLADEAGVLHRDGDRLVTTNGNYVLATGTAPADEELTVIATGAIAVYATTTVAVTAIEHEENLAMAIAERVYAVGVDCDFRYAVAVTG